MRPANFTNLVKKVKKKEKKEAEETCHSAHLPNVHEAQSSDIGGVAVGEEAVHLFTGQLQCEQLVE